GLLRPAFFRSGDVMKPYADAAEENKTVVLPLIARFLPGVDEVLELGSGTGQQIVYFAGQYPQVRWQATDLPENLPGIQAWIDAAGLDNLPPAQALDVAQPHWPFAPQSLIYTSNTLHIMSKDHVRMLFCRLAEVLNEGGHFLVYGPFRFADQPFAQSNARFDRFLRERDPRSGIRDFEEICAFAQANGLAHQESIALPHNNHMLVFRREAH
ncbi:DUF938 domain-containing protein, partial [Granulosicoccaceae sp. 1_MG-2023]|nr:DUF938 domain-containing protein [Granulosicoccaceae sp. 1_MG-2023]